MGSVPNSAVPPTSKYIHRTVRIFYKCWYSKTFFKTFRLNSIKWDLADCMLYINRQIGKLLILLSILALLTVGSALNIINATKSRHI